MARGKAMHKSSEGSRLQVFSLSLALIVCTVDRPEDVFFIWLPDGEPHEDTFFGGYPNFSPVGTLACHTGYILGR